ncbi:MAG: hypothetical protein ABMA64_39835, partial [Myxococcota bacterium]
MSGRDVAGAGGTDPPGTFTAAGSPWPPPSPDHAPWTTEIRPLRDRSGEPHVAIVFRPPHDVHPRLSAGLEPHRPFLEAPGVDGVAPWVQRPRPGTFLYPIGDGTLLVRMLDTCAERRRPAGVHAALELLQALGPVLDDAARAGRKVGLGGHGGLEPSRVLIHPMGGGSVIGHGIPRVDLITWLAEGAPEAPSGLRYLAPERVTPGATFEPDLKADLYALAMISAEVALGSPLIDATSPMTLVERIREGGAAAAVRAAGLPPPFTELLAEALGPDPATRPTGRALASRAG